MCRILLRIESLIQIIAVIVMCLILFLCQSICLSARMRMYMYASIRLYPLEPTSVEHITHIRNMAFISDLTHDKDIASPLSVATSTVNLPLSS